MASESVAVETTEKKSSSWDWLDKALSAVSSVASAVSDVSSKGVEVAKNYKVASDTLNGKTVYTVEKSNNMSFAPIIGVIGAIALASIIL